MTLRCATVLSQSGRFSYDPPRITEIDPPNGPTIGSTPIILTGNICYVIARCCFPFVRAVTWLLFVLVGGTHAMSIDLLRCCVYRRQLRSLGHRVFGGLCLLDCGVRYAYVVGDATWGWRSPSFTLHTLCWAQVSATHTPKSSVCLPLAREPIAPWW